MACAAWEARVGAGRVAAQALLERLNDPSAAPRGRMPKMPFEIVRRQFRGIALD
jgi:hypothetical protein